jgi:steroid 5-alpha reductase family enzyme
MAGALFTAAITIFVYMVCSFVVAQVKKNNGLVDIAWGLGFIVVMVVQFVRRPEIFPAKVLVAAAIVVWGLRLATHIFKRNWGKPEDFRYGKMRQKWGAAVTVKSFFFIFMLQGFLMLVVSLPITVVFASPARPLGVLDIVGVIVFSAGLLFEAIADAQLAAHIKEPANKGRLMTRGLWSTTRHPNYFGEAMLWWGIGIMAISSPAGWIALIGPLTITLLLRFVSGVPLLEKKYAGRPDWETYKTKTPVFVPGFSKQTRGLTSF